MTRTAYNVHHMLYNTSHTSQANSQSKATKPFALPGAAMAAGGHRLALQNRAAARNVPLTVNKDASNHYMSVSAAALALQLSRVGDAARRRLDARRRDAFVRSIDVRRRLGCPYCSHATPRIMGHECGEHVRREASSSCHLAAASFGIRRPSPSVRAAV